MLLALMIILVVVYAIITVIAIENKNSELGLIGALMIGILVTVSIIFGMSEHKQYTKECLIEANLARYEADPVTGKVKFIIPDSLVSKAFLDAKGNVK